MKVVHINTSVSEASAITRLHRALLQKGIDSEILTMAHTGNIPEAYDLKYGFWAKASTVFRIKKNARKRKQASIYPDIPFSLGDLGYHLANHSLIQDADVIHLHWICHILSIENIGELRKLNKAIVWTCHDSWAFTGGCHVRCGCMNFQYQCGSCPELCSDNKKDLSYKILQKKKKMWRNNHIVLIAPSNWMKENILDSSLLCHNHVVVIPNTLDTDIYHKVNCEKRGNKKTILFGAANAQTSYKGFDYLIKMLEELLRINSAAVQEYELQFVGTDKIEHAILERYECKFGGFVSEQEKMAKIYSSADVFICPSLDDNLPGMVMESMACETPVVAFSIGGIPDMIEHKWNGYLAEYKNAKDLAEGLMWVLENNQDGRIGLEARKKVLRDYNNEVVASKHIEVYNSLIGGDD